MPELNSTDEIIDEIVADFGKRIRETPRVIPQGQVKLSKEETRQMWPKLNAAQRQKVMREQGVEALIDLGRKE